MIGTLAESDERDVGVLPRGHGADVCDVDLSGDDLVSEGDHAGGDEGKAILALVRDQDA